MKRWTMFLIVFVVLAAVFILVWPGGLLTHWGWNWDLAKPSSASSIPSVAEPVKTEVASKQAVEPVINTDMSSVGAIMVNPTCPTEREFAQAIGVVADIDRTEFCSFHWRGDPNTFVAEHPCPAGWICTLGTNDKNFVYIGDDNLKPIEIFSGTWRKIDQYPSTDSVQDKCAFLKKVQNEGQVSDPQWTAEAGNFTCP